MENRGVLIGSIVFVFGAFVLMISLLGYESYKAKQMKALASSIKTETRPAPISMPSLDYSMYKTKISDEGREMVEVPEGPFIMGSKDGDPDEVPERQVYLKAFYIDRKEVSQEEYARFAKMTKRLLPKIEVFEDDQSKLLQPEFAAMSMSWDEAVAYCKWAGKRLPTEAEWEKAARGGLDRNHYAWGDANIDTTERYLQSPQGAGRLNTDERIPAHLAGTDAMPVGSFQPNGYGLYDIIGNVREWVNDWYDPDYYRFMPKQNPQGPETGRYRGVRGGGWLDAAPNTVGGPSDNNTVDTRDFSDPELRATTIGFRCAK